MRIENATSALDYAKRYASLPLREGPVKNRSADIDALSRVIGIEPPKKAKTPGPPYCAIGVCACFVEYFRDHYGREREMIRTASSQAIRRYFEARDALSYDPMALLQWEGALFGWTNVGDPGHGHVGFVAGRLTDSRTGKVVGIRTVEFNSDLSGNRDGEGCYQLVRRRISTGGGWRVENAAGQKVGKIQRLWFCNTTGFNGGKFWGK